MPERWHERARGHLRHSLKARLVAVFLLLALALAGVFLAGMQKAIGIGWRDAARPLLTDYVDRLATEIGSPPSVERAQAIAARLPVNVRITGPQVNWDSRAAPADAPHWHGRSGAGEARFLARTSADGHRIEFGLNVEAWRERPRMWGWFTLAVLLALTLLAYKYVRRLLRPLDDIRAGAQRFGRGEFAQSIPILRRDELGELAGDVNAMARGIHDMLEAKRALLLAISHELRSPLTRARLNAELLPEEGEGASRRAALLRDLEEMADLVTELLESERLGQGHAALHTEPTDLGEFVLETLQGQPLEIDIQPGLPMLELDRVRMRLLLRNLADNALRHGAGGQPPVVRVASAVASVSRQASTARADSAAPTAFAPPGERPVVLSIRDYGPGVHEAALSKLAQPFYRTDASRERTTGGVGLGLYLCRLVAQAHGATFELRNATPGLEAVVRFKR